MSAGLYLHSLAMLVTFALGGVVWATHPGRFVNRVFFALSSLLGLWLAFSGVGMLARDHAQLAQAMVSWSCTTALFLPIALNLLREAMSGRQEAWGPLLRRAAPWLIASALVAALCHTSFFIRGIRPPDPAMNRWIAEPIYGPGLHVFSPFITASFAYVVVGYLRSLRLAEGAHRVELQFTVLGTTLGIAVGVTLGALVPMLTGSSQSVQWMSLCVVILDGVTAYGIATRQIMEVADVLRRATAYALLALYVAALYLITFWVASTLLGWRLEHPREPAHLIAAIAAAFALAPANGRMQALSNQLFLNVGVFDLARTLDESNRILRKTVSREELLARFAKLLSKSFGTDHVRILLPDHHTFVQHYPPPAHPPAAALGEASPIIRHVRAHCDPLVLDVVARVRSAATHDGLAEALRAEGAAIAAGINPHTELRGLLLLGARLTGRVYGVDEQRALQVLANQLAVGLENVELYTSLQNSAIYNDILLDNLVSGVIAANAAHRVTVYNREAQRILRLPPDQVLHQPIDALPAPLARRLQEAFDRQLGERDADLLLRVDSDDLPLRIGSAVFHSRSGKRLGALLVIQDLTALRKLEDQIRRNDRLASLGTLSAGMAHEIKNPLVALKTFAQLLPERYDDPDFRNTFSSLLGSEVQRIDGLVNQLLRFARPAHPSLAPIGLHDVIASTLRLVQQQLRQKNIGLQQELRADPDLILGDASLLAQALLNFCLNALDAMEGGGTLGIRTGVLEQDSRQGPCLRLSIADTGRGIPPEELPQIFDPFFTTKSSGTGLGLSVSHRIIQEHNGHIEVESTPGLGTVFHLYLPLHAAEVPA